MTPARPISAVNSRVLQFELSTEFSSGRFFVTDAVFDKFVLFILILEKLRFVNVRFCEGIHYYKVTVNVNYKPDSGFF